MATHEPNSAALQALFWREEILEVVLWLRGEGFDERIDASLLQRFLGLYVDRAARHLERMVADGLLHPLPNHRYRLTDRGETQAQRLIGSARTTRSHSGPCGPVCWCDLSPIEAAACASTSGPHTGPTAT